MTSTARSRAPQLSFWLIAAITATAALLPAPAKATVLLFDDFNTGTVTQPNTTTIGDWSGGSGTSEADSKLTVSTTSSTGSASTNFNTSVRPELNPFTQTIQFSVTDFALFGTGDYAAGTAGRFRIGLNSNGGSFFGTDDAFALEINNNGLGFRLGTKLNAPSADPGSGAISNTSVSAAITAFDFSFTATTWALTLYDAGGATLYDQTGTWSLGNADSWGAGTGNNGSSALLMAVQNSGGAAGATGNKSFSIGSITVSATAIPEPTRLLLLAIGLAPIILRRRRP